MKTEEDLEDFQLKLIDRFGELPVQVEDLLNSVRIKWVGTQLGFEKLVMKQNKTIGYFIKDQQSSFYQSSNFTKILSYVQSHSSTCKMKEKETRQGLRLLLIFDKVKSVEEALKVLQPILE